MTRVKRGYVARNDGNLFLHLHQDLGEPIRNYFKLLISKE
jgi:hypothetical protein